MAFVKSSAVPDSRKIFGNIASALGVRLVGLGLATAVTAVLARLIGPADLGTYFLAVSVVTALALVASGGIKQTVVRLIAESLAAGNRAGAARIVRLAFTATGLGGVACAVLLLSGIGKWVAQTIFSSPTLAFSVPILAAWVIFQGLQTPVAETFRGLHRQTAATFYDGPITSATFLLFLLGTWISRTPIGLQDVVNLAALATLLTIALGMMHLRFSANLGYPDDSIRMRDMSRIMAPVLATNLTVYITSSAMLWIAGAFLLPAEVGFYGAALRLVSIIILPLTLINLVIQPYIAELNKSKGYKELEPVLRANTTIAAIPAIVLLVASMIGADTVLRLVFGPSFADAATVLRILAIGHLVNVFTGSCGTVLLMSGHQAAMMKLTMLISVLGIVLALCSVQQFGLVGISCSAALAIALQNITALILVRHKLGIWTHLTLDHSVLRRAFAKRA